MNILNKLTIKHLKLNKKRTIVTIIGIILSTALMVGIGTLFSSFREYLIKEAIASSGSHHVLIKDISYDDYKYIKNNVNVKETVLESKIGYSYLSESQNEDKPYLYIESVDNNYFETTKLLKGRYPKNENEVVISNHILKNAQVPLEIGDTLSLDIGYRKIGEKDVLWQENPYINDEVEGTETLEPFTKKDYKIVGIVERLNQEPYSAPGYTVLTKINEKSISKDSKISVFVTYKSIKNTVDKTQKICDNIESECTLNYNNSLLSLSGESTYSNVNNTMFGVITVILILITVGCAIVIYNSFAISVMERKKQFGLFSSIGATKTQIKKTVFFEAFIVSIIGIPIGIISGIFGIYVVLEITNNLLKDMFQGNLTLALYPLFIIIPIIYMIITIIISAYLPSKSASKISPIEAIRLNDDIKISRRNVKTNKFVQKLFGIEGELAFKNIKRNKKKYRITILSLVVSIVLFISFSTFIEYGNAGTSDFLQIKDYDIITTMYQKDDNAKMINEIVGIDLIDNYSIVRTRYGSLNNYEKLLTKESKKYIEKIYNLKLRDLENLTVKFLALDDNSYKNYLKEIGLNYNNYNGEDIKPILINRAVTYDEASRKTIKYTPFNIKTSDKVEITFTNYDENGNIIDSKNLNFNITVSSKAPKYLDDFLNDINLNFIVSNKMMNQLQKNITDKNNIEKTIFIQSKEHEKVTKKIENIIDSSSNSEGCYVVDVTNAMEMQRNLVIVIGMFLYGFITLVTLIGVTSVFNTINTSIALRRKEFAVLRSIGLTPKGFNKMIRFESLLYGLKALIYSLPLSALIIFIFHKIFGNITTGEILIPWKAIIISVFGVFIITSLSMMYASKKIKKENILDAIREENI